MIDEQKMVTEKMVAAGNKITSDLIDAQITFQMSGMDGSKNLDEFLSRHDGKNIDLIQQYIDGDIDMMTVIYIAMYLICLLKI